MIESQGLLMGGFNLQMHRPEFHGNGSIDTRLLGDSSFIERVLVEAE